MRYPLVEQILAAGFQEIHQVAPGIYRGSQPDLDGLKELKSMGIKTLLDLNDVQLLEEATAAEELGLDYIGIPILTTCPIDESMIAEALGVLSDSDRHPVYVHCQHGHDRTGLVIGLYRVLRDNWTAEDAFQEMLAMDFHPDEIYLEQYFWEQVQDL